MSNNVSHNGPWEIKELDSGYIRISHEDYFNFCQIEKSEWPSVTLEEIRENCFRPYMSKFISRLHSYSEGLQMANDSFNQLSS